MRKLIPAALAAALFIAACVIKPPDFAASPAAHSQGTADLQLVRLAYIPAPPPAPPAPTAPDPDDITAFSHYIHPNAERYAAYISENPELDLQIAVAYVNAGLDVAFFEDIIDITVPQDWLVLVNKRHSLDKAYVPSDLRPALGSNQQLRTAAALALERMAEQMKQEGMRLFLRSGYRSYNTQRSLYYRPTSSDRYNARPGLSEHQTGLAADVVQMYTSAKIGTLRFEKTPQYEWLLQNAYRYGFILRYPKEYTNITGYSYEPWHWRYVGIHAATKMHSEGVATLEEYYGRYLITPVPVPGK
ncbi:MAG: M15 family metallopeptidase [Oscillospiraceae bacterium]|jgi:D-alanyl-D-alanine carboxypeptidase|nr:M15 family metallopeptidase [Oscillospiraceae bacterium]